jgi:hypothetical protein
MESYFYPTAGQSQPSGILNRLEQTGFVIDPIPLTGFVQGRKASDIEERFARALERSGLKFLFQARVSVMESVPGQDKLVDFMVDAGNRYPIEIDGPIAHRTAAQKGKDLIREILLNHTFLRRGIMPIRRVKWWQLEIQSLANRLVGELFGGGR